MAILYLASQSPRRRELLAQIGVDFAGLRVAVDETPLHGEVPAVYVERMARDKARAGLTALADADYRDTAESALTSGIGGDQTPSRKVVLGADTAVVVGGEILGKPAGRAEGLAMLRRLAARQHEVLSAVCLADGERENCEVVATRVRFRAINEAELAGYWASGEPADKAGAYAIQGLAAVFVEELNGSYSGVVGLPLFQTVCLLRAFGVPCGIPNE